MMKAVLVCSIVCFLILGAFADNESQDKLNKLLSLKKTLRQQAVAKKLALNLKKLKLVESSSQHAGLKQILAKANGNTNLPKTPRRINADNVTTAQDLLDLLDQERVDTVPIFRDAIDHLDNYYIQINESINATVIKSNVSISNQTDRFEAKLQDIKDAAGDTDISSCLGFNEDLLGNLTNEGYNHLSKCIETTNKTADFILNSVRYYNYNAIRYLDHLVDQVKGCEEDDQECLDIADESIAINYAPDVLQSFQTLADAYVENAISLIGTCADNALLHVLDEGTLILAIIQECVNNS